MSTLLCISIALLLTPIHSGNINCSYAQCQYQHINCECGSICNIYCAKEACLQSQINCADNYDCNIYLSEYQSAFRSRIYGNFATKLSIYTSDSNNGDSQLEQSIINCPTNASCSVQCNNDYHVCRLTKINAESSNSLAVQCSNKNEACIDLNVWCPMGGINNCHINGYIDTSAMTQMDIYAIRGFETVQIGGTPSAVSIGTMHCLWGYTAECEISAIDNNQCASSSNTICNHPFVTTPSPEPERNTDKYCVVDIQYVILSSIMILMTAYIIYTFLRKEDEKILSNKSKIIRYVAMLQMISLWFSYLFWIIQIITGSYCNDSNGSVLYMMMSIINYIFFVMTTMAFYCYMFCRLQYTFSDSIYKMGRKSIYFHRFIVLFIPIWYSMLAYYVYNDKIYFYVIFCVIGFVLIFVGLLHLMLVFNRNLFQSLVSHQKLIESSQHIPIYTSLTAVQKKEEISIKLITKHALLTSIMFLVGIMLISVFCILHFKSKSRTDSSWIIYEWFLAFSMIINLLCVYFGFDINDKQYQKVCRLCNARMLKICQFCVGRGNKRSVNDAMSSISSLS